MPSQIDPTKPVDGVPSIKADLRLKLQSARDEIEALQTGKTDFGHQHVLAEVTDSGALASKSIVQSEDVAAAAITGDKLAAAAVGATKLADAAVTTPKLADGAVTSDKLGPASVSVGKIGPAAVNTAELANDAVTTAKLAHGTANRLLGFDASGAPGEIAAGSNVMVAGGTIAVVPGSLTDLTDTPNSYLPSGRQVLTGERRRDSGRICAHQCQRHRRWRGGQLQARRLADNGSWFTAHGIRSRSPSQSAWCPASRRSGAPNRTASPRPS